MTYLKKIVYILFIFIFSFLAYSPTVFAVKEEMQNILKQTAQEASYDVSQTGSDGAVKIVASLIKMFLSILGIIFLGIVLYAGFLWMTAGGSDDNIKKAKGLLINGVVGLALIVASYAIADFVIKQLTTAITNH